MKLEDNMDVHKISDELLVSAKHTIFDFVRSIS